MMKLSVIIVNYNVKYYLEQCLRSVFTSLQNGVVLEVLVVDNASPDQSAQYLRKQFPKSSYPNLHIISNSHNVGFGKANNQAVKLAKGEYILFLNPDTVISEHTLEDCLEFADNHPDFGALGTMMMHDNGRFAYESRRGMPTPWVSFCKMTGLNAIFPHSRLFGKYYMRYLKKEETAEIQIISGAFMMTRKKVLDVVGVFDEDFFMYGEDIDLSYRILQAGFKNYYVPFPILHYKGESTKKNTFKYVHVFYSAMLIFFKKHFHSYWLGFSVPIKLAIVVSAVMALLKQQLKMLQHFLLPVRKIPRERMLYVGKNMASIRRLVDDWGLDMDYLDMDEQSLPDGDLPSSVRSKGYVRIIYDTDNFSYDYMLKNIATSKHESYLGIYHSSVGVLITGARSFVPQAIEL